MAACYDKLSEKTAYTWACYFAMTYETGAQWSDVCAATFLVVAPLLIVFLFFQKQFIESFAHSGLK